MSARNARKRQYRSKRREKREMIELRVASCAKWRKMRLKCGFTHNTEGAGRDRNLPHRKDTDISERVESGRLDLAPPTVTALATVHLTALRKCVPADRARATATCEPGRKKSEVVANVGSEPTTRTRTSRRDPPNPTCPCVGLSRSPVSGPSPYCRASPCPRPSHGARAQIRRQWRRGKP